MQDLIVGVLITGACLGPIVWTHLEYWKARAYLFWLVHRDKFDKDGK